MRENYSNNRKFRYQPELYRSNYSKIHELIPNKTKATVNKIISAYLPIGNYDIIYRQIQLCKERLITVMDKKFKIYVDGSVRYQQTENIEAIIGVMIYNEDNTLIDSIFLTFENWITSNKAETLAFLVALLVTPVDKESTIYTDSQQIYNNFTTIVKHPHKINLRDILKFNANNHIWAIIKDMLENFALKIKVEKVKAHDEDILHNIVDREITERYLIIQQLNNIDVLPTCDIYKYPLKWDGVSIETNIRRFIRLISRVEGLEKFFNLNRNAKYHMLEIEWHITFMYLDANEEEFDAYFKTSAHSSKKKRMKIQRLIEELPTIKQMKNLCTICIEDYFVLHATRKKKHSSMCGLVDIIEKYGKTLY